MSNKNVQVTLANRPTGWVQESDFKIVESDIPKPAAGQVLVKNLYLSLDPYMRGRMNAGPSYAANVAIGQVMVGGTVGEVVESSNPNFKPGDSVVGYFGWQQYGVSSGAELQKVDAKACPAVRLSRRGRDAGSDRMVGADRYRRAQSQARPSSCRRPEARSAASSGKSRRSKGCRAVGIAGGKEKCDLVVKEFGFDACVDYKGGNLAKDLRAAAPKGIDIYFENVGGVVLETVALQLNPFARIPLCGLISQYNEAASAWARQPRDAADQPRQIAGLHRVGLCVEE